MSTEALIDTTPMVFPKTQIDPELLTLEHDVVEFITSVILHHENIFYEIIMKHCPDEKHLLDTNNVKICKLIVAHTNQYFNKCYSSIQNKIDTDLTKYILAMAKTAKYGAHILLDKLIRLSFDIHINFDRENLCINNRTLFEKTVLGQINTYLLSTNIVHIFSKGPNDDTEFVNVPDGEQPFNITISN